MDIVERLRGGILSAEGSYDAARDLMDEAADEIERLREALILIRVVIENYGLGGKSEGFALGYVDEVARVALQQNDSE